MKKGPRGIVPAMLTIFDKDGNLDLEGQKQYANWLIKKGVHGLAPCGSTGEGAALNDDERVAVVKATVEAAKGKVPVYAGIIGYSTKLACDLAKRYKEVGADGIMCLLPFYYHPNVKDAMEHIRAVSKAWGGPVMVYNNPWFAGFELDPSQVKELADDGVVNSIKAAHGDPMRCDFVKYLCKDEVTVLYGHDYAPLEAFSVGADGWLSGLPNVVPDLCVELFEAIDKDHDLDKARKVWDRIIPIAYYFMYVRRSNSDPHWLPMIKQAVTMQGMDVGLPRLPAKEMAYEDKKILFDYLVQVYPSIKL